MSYPTNDTPPPPAIALIVRLVEALTSLMTRLPESAINTEIYEVVYDSHQYLRQHDR